MNRMWLIKCSCKGGFFCNWLAIGGRFEQTLTLIKEAGDVILSVKCLRNDNCKDFLCPEK